METIWHHFKLHKRSLSTKTHRPGKNRINQRLKKDTKENTEGDAEIHSGEVSVHRTTLRCTSTEWGFMEEKSEKLTTSARHSILKYKH